VPENRPPNPPFQKPLPASIEAAYPQEIVSYQFVGFGQRVAPEPHQAAAYYTRASELKSERRFAEALAAYDAAVALKPDYAEAQNGRAIVLASLNRLAEAIVGFDRAIALRPDYAEAHNNRGIALQELSRLDEALASFDRAITLQPENAFACNNRGTALFELKRFEEALASHEKAIALKQDYAEAHYNRGIVLHELNRLDEALASCNNAIALKPGYAAAHNNRGTVLHDLQRLDEALVAFDKAITLTGGFAEAYLNQSYCLLQMGRFEEGWRLHEWRKTTEKPVGNRSFPQPLWLGREDIADKTVFVHWEQGFGDTIQFCRYGSLLKERGATVAMSVQEPLYRLISQSAPGIAILKNEEAPAAFDYHCPLMSLPFAFGTTLKNVPVQQPYIFADDALRKAWEARLPPRVKPRIGAVWSGSAKQKNDRNRSVGLSAFAALLSVDAHWISLQKELRDGDAALLQEFPQISHCGAELGDFSDTAAAIAALDLVVTVDTSVAHLAGAMGKPVWILLADNADWRWLRDREDCPWYSSARLFRQDKARSWEDVIARVHAALCDFVRSHLGKIATN
jgi:tetratricopeptide (TPR) repeat protein